jgi:hypothetical protein
MNIHASDAIGSHAQPECDLTSSRSPRNEILFDEEGNYAGFDRSAPTSASGGKPKVLKLMTLGCTLAADGCRVYI